MECHCRQDGDNVMCVPSMAGSSDDDDTTLNALLLQALVHDVFPSQSLPVDHRPRPPLLIVSLVQWNVTAAKMVTMSCVFPAWQALQMMMTQHSMRCFS